MNLTDFPLNKYTKHYIALIKTRESQGKIQGETESHHIFPVSIFGSNTSTVNLTYREHFVAHLLLWKMYDKEYGESHSFTKKMIKAVFSFVTKKSNENIEDVTFITSSRSFERARKLGLLITKENLKRMWEDADMRSKLTAHRQAYWGTQDNRLLQSQRRVDYFNTDEGMQMRQKISEHFIELSKQPEYQEYLKNPERLKNSFHSQEAQAKRLQSLKDGGSEKARETYLSRYSPEERSEISRVASQANLAKYTQEERSARIQGREKYISLENGSIKMLFQAPTEGNWLRLKDLPLQERRELRKQFTDKICEKQT